MISVSVVNADGVLRNMERLKQDLGATRARALVSSSLLLRRELAEQMTQPARTDSFWGRTGAWVGLSTRTGGTKGRLSPGGQIYHQGDTAFTAVGSPDAYVKDLEEGGTRSSGGGYFRIPTAAAQTGAGVDRLLGRSFRDFEGGFLVRSRQGRLWGATREGGRLVLLYLFVRSIHHAAHRVFMRARDATAPKVAQLFGQEIAVAVRRNA